MKINCIVVEDEPPALKRLETYIGKLPYLQLLKSFDNGFDAIDFLKNQRVDLMFLDIKMDELTGIQLLEALERKPAVIITTAYHDYALKGYDLNVSDYLLKPFGIERFIQAVEKVFYQLNRPKHGERDYFFLKVDYKIEKIIFKDIIFIEGMRDYRCVQMTNKRLLTARTFSELEADLPTSDFCRVHKSYIVAFDKIELVEKNRIKIKDKYIPISDSYKNNFYSSLGFGQNKKRIE